MKYVTRIASTAICAVALVGPFASADTFEEILRTAIIKNGFLRSDDIRVDTDAQLVAVGKSLFESTAISINAGISCQNCHLDEFSSADGIPNAIGVGGEGAGQDRLTSGGAIVPRNTLPLWGVGSAKYEVFFWDGKVDFVSGDQPISQFGDALPSTDALEVAVHLPAVEIREMLIEDQFVHSSKTESTESADQVYSAIVDNFKRLEPDIIEDLAYSLNVDQEEITFQHIAQAIAAFIRAKFAIRETPFHRFVFANASLTADEVAGARLFYGKGKCAVCHSGPYLTDFDFHAVALPQRGFGKNGFGVDYGRFNVTHNPRDLYKFRTPPLFNVENTAPYGHSGSAESLESAVIAHFDPLRLFDAQAASPMKRTEFYKTIAASADDLLTIAYLSDHEVANIVSFLRTLSFQADSNIGSQTGLARSISNAPNIEAIVH